MASENEFLLHALLMGIFITFLYDLLRVFRRVVPHRGFFVSAEDLLFWVYCGGEVFLLMYREGDGTLRWFAVMGALAGMCLYKKTVSPLFVKYASLALNWVLGILCRPLKWICRGFRKAAGRAGRGLGKLFARLRRRVKNRLTYFVKVLKIALKA